METTTNELKENDLYLDIENTNTFTKAKTLLWLDVSKYEVYNYPIIYKLNINTFREWDVILNIKDEIHSFSLFTRIEWDKDKYSAHFDKLNLSEPLKNIKRLFLKNDIEYSHKYEALKNYIQYNILPILEKKWWPNKVMEIFNIWINKHIEYLTKGFDLYEDIRFCDIWDERIKILVNWLRIYLQSIIDNNEEVDSLKDTKIEFTKRFDTKVFSFFNILWEIEQQLKTMWKWRLSVKMEDRWEFSFILRK